MLVLGIETSCDETGVALYRTGHRLGSDTTGSLLVGHKLVGHKLYSQVSLHARYGGVVPELASRDHIRKTLPLLSTLLSEIGVSIRAVEGIAYTAGPGLVGALMVGAGLARSMAFALSVPCLGVHHMEGHLLAPLLEGQAPPFPFIALLVSGGHTQLVAVTDIGVYQLLGESLDDAAGEAFDKTATLLGLPYPGGPALAQAATQGTADRFTFPRPMVDRPGLDFSFSGLKTHARNTIERCKAAGELDQQCIADIALAFQNALVATLTIKCKRALQQSHGKTLVIAGGVSANQALRQALEQMTAALGARLFYARPEFCTDNGAMIALVGALRLQAGQHDHGQLRLRPRWPIDELPTLSMT